MFSGLWQRLKPTRRRVVVYIAVVLGILALRLVLDVWAGSRLQAVTDRLAPAYGGRLDAYSLSPPAVAPGENRARIASAAAALTGMPQDGIRIGQLTGALLGTAPADPKQRLAILRQAVSESRLALQVLDEIESRPKANWELIYSDGHRMRLPSLMAIRNLGDVNAAAGRVALAEGNGDEAVRRARLGLALAGSLGQEPNLLIQLIHLAVGNEQLRLIRDVLAAGEPSEAALESLAERLETEGAQDPVVTGLVGELKVINGTLGSIESGAIPWDTQDGRSGFWSRALAWFVRPAMRFGHARALGDLDQTTQYARLRPFEREARKLRLPNDEPQPWWWQPFSSMFVAGLGRAVRSGDEHRAMLVLAATSVALRRCRIEKGSYPEHLDELNPVYLPDVPVDPFTGREPEYARSGAGFTVKVAVPAGTAEPTRRLLEWTVPR
jgi:hypothetical protein